MCADCCECSTWQRAKERIGYVATAFCTTTLHAWKSQGCETVVPSKQPMFFPSLVQSGSITLSSNLFVNFSRPHATLANPPWGLRARLSQPAAPLRRFSKAIRARPADASLYWGRSHAWERAGNRRQAVVDAGVGVCLRPRVAAGFDRLSAAYEAQGRYADVVRACFLVREGNKAEWGGVQQLGRRPDRKGVSEMLCLGSVVSEVLCWRCCVGDVVSEML